MLQIVEEAERTNAMSDLERDIILNELREAYSEVKFGVAENTPAVAPAVAPVAESVTEPAAAAVAAAPLQQEPDSEVDSEEDNEPEVEFEIIFNEEDDEEDAETDEAVADAETEDEEVAVPEFEDDEEGAAAPVDLSQLFEAVGLTHATNDEVTPESVVESTVVEAPDAPNNTAQAPAPKRSPLLSLYEDDAPVLGEQFRETPSVADAITCPKGVAESTPVTSLREAIGVADRYMFIRELFDGDDEAYDAAITNLDKLTSFDDCVIYISENYVWRAQSEAAKTIMSLLKRKFNE